MTWHFGHAPSNPPGNAKSLPPNDLSRFQFGRPGGNDPHQPRGGAPATAAQRYCMEAIQRGDSRTKLVKRFPERMVRRLLALQDAAEDPESKFFLQAQLLIRTILIAPVHNKNAEDSKPPEVIEVKTGRIEVPMPGAPGDIVPPVADVKAG